MGNTGGAVDLRVLLIDARSTACWPVKRGIMGNILSNWGLKWEVLKYGL